MAATAAKLQTPVSEPGGSAADEKATANWNNKKFRDEYESSRSKLIDQRFDPKQFADPLLPRRSNDARNNPRGSTPEAERRVDQIIAAHKV